MNVILLKYTTIYQLLKQPLIYSLSAFSYILSRSYCAYFRVFLIISLTFLHSHFLSLQQLVMATDPLVLAFRKPVPHFI
jgi:hypothetical protein